MLLSGQVVFLPGVYWESGKMCFLARLGCGQILVTVVVRTCLFLLVSVARDCF